MVLHSYSDKTCYDVEVLRTLDVAGNVNSVSFCYGVRDEPIVTSGCFFLNFNPCICVFPLLLED